MLDMETKLKLAIQEALSKIGANVETKDIVTMSPVQTDGLDNWLKDVFSQEV